jgi:diguanylate cyclase (GGDEF)-like protein
MRIQTVGAVLFALISVIGIGATYRSRVDTDAAKQHAIQVVSALEIGKRVAINRWAEAELVLRDSEPNSVRVRQSRREIASRMAQLTELLPSPALVAQGRALQRAFEACSVDQRLIAALVDRGLHAQARMIFDGPMARHYAVFDALDTRLAETLRAEAFASADRVRKMAGLMISILLIAAALGLMLMLLLRRFVRMRIVDSLVSITGAISDVAAGNVGTVVRGGERKDEIGQMVRALEVFRLQAKALEEDHIVAMNAHARAEALARHDALTGLPNRRMFVEALSAVLETPEQPAAVMLIDLDRFKPINDAYGHEAGDEVLCELARRFVDHRDTLGGAVARIGGDEFAVVFPLSSDSGHAARIAGWLNLIVAQPIELHNGSVEVGSTIGIALFPQDGTDANVLLHAADLAMYAAKSERNCRYHFFTPAMGDHVQQRALLRTDLRRAIAANEIRPHYQPLVTIDDGTIVGFEILARWYHPTRGIITPDVFIELADELGVLTDLTCRIVRQACVDARNWPVEIGLSLNLAPSQIRDPSLEGQLIGVLAEGGISPKRIEIEITENALITDLAATREVLAALQGHGMSIALDDFGTGYASLNHLRDLKFDKIKIDRSFVSDLEAGGKNAEIVHAIISLSRVLGLTTTAEGVEDAAQWAQLASWGCNLGQGYLFGKGMSADHAGELLTASAKARREAACATGSGSSDPGSVAVLVDGWFPGAIYRRSVG